ncbi:hypothetical protein TNCV_4450061 [Trichonephila clavipes]|nr:hypothetical protein TNCV_4450061 [Trichonephila clavipes]
MSRRISVTRAGALGARAFTTVLTVQNWSLALQGSGQAIASTLLTPHSQTLGGRWPERATPTVRGDHLILALRPDHSLLDTITGMYSSFTTLRYLSRKESLFLFDHIQAAGFFGRLQSDQFLSSLLDSDNPYCQKFYEIDKIKNSYELNFNSSLMHHNVCDRNQFFEKQFSSHFTSNSSACRKLVEELRSGLLGRCSGHMCCRKIDESETSVLLFG